MREVNFSIPNANKASVGITAALYDRRALDCTSTLPLMNSLNHLVYLTTSSARIRDILTVDGGIERLVCILKEGRSKDVQEVWKWNLALQCVFNVGVRGSENVRTRVVEADMVPVIATILDNYIKVVDTCREKAEAEMKRNCARLGASARLGLKPGSLLDSSDRGNRYSRLLSMAEHRSSRRQPPPIEIPPLRQTPQPDPNAMEITSPGRPTILTSPPERTTFSRHLHHNHHWHRHNDSQNRPSSSSSTTSRHSTGQPPATAVPTMSVSTVVHTGLRPVRDVDRLPSMLPALHVEVGSQPETPTTPSQGRPIASRTSVDGLRPRLRPPMRHQVSVSAESEEGPSYGAEDSGSATETEREPAVDILDGSGGEDDVRPEPMLEDTDAPIPVPAPTASDNGDNDVLNIAGPGVMDGSIINAGVAALAGDASFPSVPPIVDVGDTASTTTALQWLPRLYQERIISSGMLPSMPRDEDVLLSLQLLAYVSKYCNLRSYFQQSHLVPKLRIGRDVQLLVGEVPSLACEIPAPKATEEELEEYLQPDDFNIFPLVEKFTVRHHPQEMQYWAGVVMRNLCRKDDSKGGIRQCAFYKCGKWEEYTRQFAKCRRCRRTKYCSKECQKSAWVYHRHWCVAAAP